MTQVELPQLSLQRYFDLVKRRRWQLIPVSLLGLVVGGLIAFFIPRYFVAETLLVHQQVPGQELPNNVEDPYRSIVDTAKSTIPLYVGDAIDEISWVEAQQLDQFARSQFERDVESRVTVNDSNRGDRSRAYAQLRVQYRDRDGERAALFLNTLVRVWIDKRIAELREPAQRQSQQAKEKADRWQNIYDKFLREKQDLERTYGIRPGMDLGMQRDLMNDQQAAAQQLKDDLRKKKVDLAQRRQQLAADEEKLAGMLPRVAPDVSQLTEMASQSEQGKKLLAAVVYWQAAMQITFHEGSPAWRRARHAHELALQQLRALVPQTSAEADGLIPNPLYSLLLAKIEQERRALEALAAEIGLIEQEIEAERLRLENLATGWLAYETKVDQLREARGEREAAIEQLRDADGILGLLTRDLPVQQVREAKAPPAPTEPNILVVALIGCVLGLGVAIGLILLFDLLQGTFKTVDDVERGLQVPVLGGVSYLETEEQRLTAVRGRRRVSMVAVAMLALITITVTIFYVDPTRLPPVVRDLLAMLLGA